MRGRYHELASRAEAIRNLTQVSDCQHFDGAPRASQGVSLRASHRMAAIIMVLTRERNNPSQIAREIESFSIFAWLVPTLVRGANGPEA